MDIDTTDPLDSQPIFPEDGADEPTDANPVPLSPTQPQRRTSDGGAVGDGQGMPIVPVVGGTGSSGTTAGIPLVGLDDDRPRADPATRDD